MARKYFEQMLDELELANFPGYPYPWWHPSQSQIFHPLPDMHHPDFRNFTRLNRHEFCPFEYFRQPYWMTQTSVYPSCEPFCFFRRNDKRNFLNRGYNSTRDKRSYGERRFYPNKQHDLSNFRVNRGRMPDFLPQFERQFQHGWNREAAAQHYHLSRENRNPSRLSFRSSDVDLCSDDIFIDQNLHSFKQMFENRNPSSNCLSVNENMRENGNSANHNVMPMDSSEDINHCKSPKIDWKEQNKISNNPFSTDDNNSYASWYCPEEQQKIVDMLKEVNLRHDRQLKRDMLLSRGGQPCSDESVSSINDSQNTERLQKSPLSSDDDEDDINILLYPSEIPSIPEAANEEDEFKSGYHEKSASDFFDEFQNIFTGSPEKKIINNMTKEIMKMPSNQQNKEYEGAGKFITDDDKNAVKTVLNFEQMDELSDKTFGECESIISSSPKETLNVISSNVSIVSTDERKDFGNACKNIFNEIKIDGEIADTISVTKSDQMNYYASEASTDTIKEIPGVVLRTVSPTQLSTNTENNSKSPCASEVRTPSSQLLRSNYDNSNQTSKITFRNKLKTREGSPRKIDCRRVMKNLTMDFEKCGKRMEGSPGKNAHGKKASEETCSPHKSNIENYQSSVTTSCSNQCAQNRILVKRGESSLSMSEPLLTPKNENFIYRRISLSEIFDNVNSNSGNDVNRFPNNKNNAQYLINHTMNVEHLSPSEHLKQILGIGKNYSSTNSIKSKERNVIYGPSLKENQFSDQSKPTFFSSSKSFSNEDCNEVSLNKSSLPKYPYCKPITSIKGKEEKLYKNQANPYYQNPKHCSEKSLGAISKNCGTGFDSGAEIANCFCVSRADIKTESETNSKKEICPKPFKEFIEKQHIKQLCNQKYESKSKNRYLEKKAFRQARKVESFLLQNSEESFRNDSFQKDISKFRNRALSSESLKHVENKLIKESESCKPSDLQKCVIPEKICDEPRVQNKIRLETPKSRKKYKKKQKGKLFDEHDDTIKCQPTDHIGDKKIKYKSVTDNDDNNLCMFNGDTDDKVKYKSNDNIDDKVKCNTDDKVKCKPNDKNSADKKFKCKSSDENDNNKVKYKTNGDNSEKVKCKSTGDECNSRECDNVKSCFDRYLNKSKIIQNKCDKTIVGTRKGNMQNKSRYLSRNTQAYECIENSEPITANSLRENKQNLENSRDFFPVASNKNSIQDSKKKDLKFEKQTEISNDEKNDTSLHKFSRLKDNSYYSKRNNYSGVNHHRESGNRHWRTRSNYIDDYGTSHKENKFNTSPNDEIKCGKEIENCQYNTHISDGYNKNISDKSKICSESINNSIIYEDSVQPLASNASSTSISQREDTSTEKVKYSKNKIPSTAAELQVHRCSDVNFQKKQDSSLKIDFIPVFYCNLPNSFPVDTVFLTMISKIRDKTQQVLQKAERIVDLIETQKQLNSLQKYRLKLANMHTSGGTFLNSKIKIFQATQKKYNCTFVDSSKPVVQKRNILKYRTNGSEKPISCSLRKINAHNYSEGSTNPLFINDDCKENIKRMRQTIAICRLSELNLKTLLGKASNNSSENPAFPLAAYAIDNFRKGQAMVLNPSFDVYNEMQLRDILCDFSSVRLSSDLRKNVNLFLCRIIEENLLHVVPLFLSFLSAISILHLPWSRDSLKQLLDLSIYTQKKNGVKLPRSQKGKISDNYKSNVLKCWDILSSYFTDKEILALCDFFSRE